MGEVRRPVMRYLGGKWRLGRWIIGHFPEHRVYVEPYGGSASVLLQKPRARDELYNDLNEEVVNVFRVLRDPEAAGGLERLLRLTPFARTEFELAYEVCEDRIERARRLIVKSFHGYGTAAASRKDRTGFRGVGFNQRTMNAAEWVKYPDAIAAFTERRGGVVIECRPALDVIRVNDRRGTLFYVDPLYVLSTRTSEADRRRHYSCELTDDDHGELARVLRACRGMVIVSGYPCELYEGLYGDWRCVRHAARSMNNAKRTECLWLSPRVGAVQLGMGDGTDE